MARIIEAKYIAKFPLAAEREYQKLMRALVRSMAAGVLRNQSKIMELIVASR